MIVRISDALPCTAFRVGVLNSLLQSAVNTLVEAEPVADGSLLDVAGIGVAIGCRAG